MSSRREQYSALARLFEYPGPEYFDDLQIAIANIGERAPSLACFTASARNHKLGELQELYTVSFDLSPACALEIGWHLFGEDYARGLLLVRMRQELRRYAVEEGTNLPDHLVSVLRLLGRMEQVRAEDFAQACVHPALVKMTLPPVNLFAGLLDAARQLVAADFAPVVSEEPAVSMPVLAEGAV